MKRPEIVVASLLLSVLAAWLATEVACYSNNSLSRHHQLELGKAQLERPPMGFFQAQYTRNMLHGNKLHLGEWHGCQEVYTAPYGSGGTCRLRFKLEPNRGCFFLLLDQRTGVRLSLNPAHPSAIVELDPKGKYLGREPLEVSLGEGWQTITLEWKTDLWVAHLNGQPLAERTLKQPAQGRLGFRAIGGGVTVDDLLVQDRAGQVTLSESFRLWSWAPFPYCLGFLLLSVALLSWFGRKHPKNHLRILVLQVMSVALLGLYLLLDINLWSARYPYHGYTPWGHNSQPHVLERYRYKLSQRVARLGLPEHRFGPKRSRALPLQLSVPEQPPQILPRDSATVETTDSPLRILLIGTSQTFGSGALHLEDCLGHQLQRKLGEATVLNTAQSGANLATILVTHQKYLDQYRPHLVVANLANNDGGEELWPQFQENLLKLLLWNRAAGARTVLCLEPNAPDAEGLANILSTHQEMRKWGAEHKVTVLDLQSELNSKENLDSGLLWWDNVHLTSYGQELAAKFLAARLKESITNQTAKPIKGI